MRVPPFPIAEGTELRYNGQLQVVRAVHASGHVELECPLRKTRFRLTVPELVTLRMRGDVQPVAAPPVHIPDGEPSYELMTTAQQKVVKRRIAYAVAAASEAPIGPKSPRLASLIHEVAQRIQDEAPPSPHSVYRWSHRFVVSGYDTAVFVQDATVMRRRTPQIAPVAKNRLREHLQVLMGMFKHTTLHGLMNLALAKTAKDLGHVSFITREREERLTDEFIPIVEAALRTAEEIGAKRHPRTRKRG